MVELVGREGSEGREDLADRHQTGIEGLISTKLVLAHLLTPEALTVQTDVPVAQVVVDEGVDETAGTRRVVAVELCLHALDEGVQTGEDPAVDLRALAEGHLLGCRVEVVDIGVEGEEAVRII